MAQEKRTGVAGPKQDEDLKRNPGIGQSKGAYATGDELEDLEAENTFEGHVENDAEPSGAVRPERLGRTDK